MTYMTFFKRWWWLVGYLAAYFVLISLVVVNRWNQYEMTYFDHGIYDQALWHASRFRTPIIDHLEALPANQLGDHFTLLLYFLTPIYWITSSYTALFYAQNLIVVFSLALLCRIAWKRIHSRWAVLLILVSSSLFIGLQNALIGDFHADMLGLFPLVLMLTYLDRKQWKLFYFWMIVLFMAKESNVIIGFSISSYLLFSKKVRPAITTLFISLFYYLITVKLVMPWLAGHSYQYMLELANPWELFLRFFTPFIKVKTIFVSLLTFGFLPLIAPSFLPVIFQDWIMRFVFNLAGTRIDLGMHYNILITFLLAYGSILGMDQVRHRYPLLFAKFIKWLSIGIIIVVVLIHRFWYRGPLGLAFISDFYQHSHNFSYLNSFISQAPKQGTIMTSNNLSVKLTHSHNVILYRKRYWDYMPDTIMVDTREGQNPNHYWPLPPSDFAIFVQRLQNDSNYSLVKFSHEQWFFLKNDHIDMSNYDPKILPTIEVQ